MKTIDMSGFGGGYEHVCQQMLKNGLDYLESKGKPDATLHGYKNVYGIVDLKGPDSKAFEDAVMKGIKDATGAMHQCVMGHLFYIAKHGHDGWIKELEKGQPERIFEWDGTVESCPKAFA